MKDQRTEMGNDWREWKEDSKKEKAEILTQRTAEILSLKEHGYDVKQITEYQFRINSRIDIYPVKRRWHDLKTGNRGSYRNVQDIF